jgi:PAS domain S-box-containing protein
MDGQNQPRRADEQDGQSIDQIALLMDHEENRHHLASWLREDTPYTPVIIETDESVPRGDLCIVDQAALLQHHDWLSDSKDREHPQFYPVLLVREEQESVLEVERWETTDETITMPVQLPELRHRLENLLERRNLTLRLSERLDRTEERYKTVFEAVNDGILVLNPEEDTIVDCNPRAADILGYSESELQSLSPCEDLHSGHQEEFRTFIDRVRDAGQARSSNLTCVLKDGSTIEAEVSAGVADEQNESRVVFSIRDITERVEQERTVKRQRDQLAELNRVTQTLYETMRAVVQASTREELETEVCDRLAESDDYQFAWIGTSENGTKIVPTAYSSNAESYLGQVQITADQAPTGEGPTGRAVETGDVTTVQNVPEDPTMEPWREQLAKFSVHATAAVPISDGERLFGVLNLYTDREEAFTGAEQEILSQLGQTIGKAITGIQAQEEAHLFRQAVEHAGHAMYITETDGTITYVNPAFEEITGYTSDLAIGQTPRILNSENHDQEFYQNLWNTILSGEIWQSEMINRRRDGRRLYIDQTIAPIVGDEDEIEHFIAVSRDITENRRQQQQLQVLYRVLRHNLRNKLNIIRGYTDLAGDTTADGESQTAATEITEAVNDLLRISQQAQRIEGTFVNDDSSREFQTLSEVVEEAINTVDREAATETTVSLPETEYKVDSELESAIRELLKNAIKHNDSLDSKVTITAEKKPMDETSWVAVSVADNGPGIPENERQVLREGEESPLLHGDGLGLWLVNWIVSEIGGEVDIQDNQPRGSIVTLHIPVSEDDEQS